MQTKLTPEQRSLKARMAGYARAAAVEAEPANLSPEEWRLLERFAKELDPKAHLHPADRYRIADLMMKEHLARLAYMQSVLDQAQARLEELATA